MLKNCNIGPVLLHDGFGDHICFSFRLAEHFNECYLNFVTVDRIPLHLKLIEADKKLFVSSFDGSWGEEKCFSVELKLADINHIDLLCQNTGVELTFNAEVLGFIPCSIDLRECTTLHNAMDSLCIVSDGPALRMAWRQCARSSGKKAPTPVFETISSLTPGITAIIRAKNEEKTILQCIEKVAPLVNKVISVDNNSSDNTYSLMKRSQLRNFNVEIFEYNCDIPRVGLEHAAAYDKNRPNTLGRYYNFCLSKCRTQNFMKWDADFLPIKENLRGMIDEHDLKTRADNFSLWFSGIAVWTDGHRYWIDEKVRYNEFRAHSKLHGAHWVDLPHWEEIDQTYLFKAQLTFYHKPVFVELFHIDTEEFDNRGICTIDKRDVRKRDALEFYKKSGVLPKGFTEIESLECDQLIQRQLSDSERDCAKYMLGKYNSVPDLSLPSTGRTLVSMETVDQPTLGVFCISHANNFNRLKEIRDSFKKDFDQLGIPFYFVIGKPGTQARIDGDVITLDCGDEYEFLAHKIAALCKFVDDRLDFEYIAKIDDDTCVDACQFSQLPFHRYDYFGGGVAGGTEVLFDWHRGKCSNPQLDDVLVTEAAGGTWYGGGFGYFLSRRAYRAIAEHHDEMLHHLYEDVAVNLILRRSGLVEDNVQDTFPVKIFASYQLLDIEAKRNIVLITDIPNNDELWAVYENIQGVPHLHDNAEALRVSTDWFARVPDNTEENQITPYEQQGDAGSGENRSNVDRLASR